MLRPSSIFSLALVGARHRRARAEPHRLPGLRPFPQRNRDQRHANLSRPNRLPLNKFRISGKIEAFQHLALHLLCKRVHLVNSIIPRANEIPQLLLSRGSLHNPQHHIRHFLSISGPGRKRRADLRRHLFDNAIRNGARFVRSPHRIPENSSFIRSRLDNHRLNSLPRKLIAVSLRQRLHRKFASAIKSRRRKNNAPRPAANVHDHPATLPPHVRKHRAIHAHHAKKIRVHQPSRLFSSNRFLQPRKVVASIIDSHIKPPSLSHRPRDTALDGSIVRHIHLQHMHRQRLLLRQPTNLRSILSVPPAGIAHSSENRMPPPSQSLREKSPKPSASPSNKNHLLGTHNRSSLCAVAVNPV